MSAFQTLTVLPNYPGDLAGGVNGISNGGLIVVGFSQQNKTAVGRPVRWVGGILQQLPYPAAGLGGADTFCFDCSSDGSIICGQGDNGASVTGAQWTGGGAGGQAVAFLSPLGGDAQSNVNNCTLDGTVFAGFSTSAGGAAINAVQWTGGSPTLLPALPGAPANPNAKANVSPDGSIFVGQCNNSSGVLHAVSWSGGVATDLGVFPGYASSLASGCSTGGTVIVGRSTTADGHIRAVVWQAGGIWLLPSLPGGGHNYVASAVTPDGSIIVGRSDDASGNVFPVCWINGVITRLPVTANSTAAANATVGVCRCVSPDGAVIGGTVNNALGNIQAAIWQ